MVGTDAAIRTEGLTKHYGDVRALIDLDLDVSLGEVYGFLGPNGSGKTTMIRTLLDEIRPTSGRAWILGLDSHRDAFAIRPRIGYVPGDLALYPNLTGQDTITYFANLRGGVDWDYVGVLAERLDADLSKKVGDLSSGNRQKVGLIQALMNRPEVLIMDEPSTGLDPLMQREFQAMLREVAAEGRAVFLSSHILSEVQRVADRVAIIRRGQLVAVESLQNLRSKALRRVHLELEAPAEAAVLARIPGVRDVTVDGRFVELSFEGKLAGLLRALAQHHEVVDVSTKEADLDEIFLAYYRDDTAPTQGLVEAAARS